MKSAEHFKTHFLIRSFHFDHFDTFLLDKTYHYWKALAVLVTFTFTYPLTTRVVRAQLSFATNFLRFSQFSTALWDLVNSRPVHSLMLSPQPLLLSTLSDPMNGRHVHTTEICTSLRWSGGLRVVRLLAGSWHGFLRY